MFLGLGHHGRHLVWAADIAGIDPQPVQAGIQGGQGQAVIEMNIGDHRQRRASLDLWQGLGRGLVWHGHPDDFATSLGQGPDLGQSGLGVPGIGVGHALHPDGVISAQEQLTQADDPGLVTFWPGWPSRKGLVVHGLP